MYLHLPIAPKPFSPAKGLLIILCQDSRPFAHHFPILRSGVSTCTTKVPTDAFAQLITFRLSGFLRAAVPLFHFHIFVPRAETPSPPCFLHFAFYISAMGTVHLHLFPPAGKIPLFLCGQMHATELYLPLFYKFFRFYGISRKGHFLSFS